MTQEVVFPVFHDAWMDNGLETLYRLLKDAQDESYSIQLNGDVVVLSLKDFDKSVKTIGIAIKNKRPNLIVMEKDKKTGEPKEVKKDYIMIQEGKKRGGKVFFAEKIFNEVNSLAEIKRIFGLITQDGKRNCVICGSSFTKSAKNLQQASYPFVTKIRSLSGVRSYKDDSTYSLNEYFYDFCPRCYIRGIIEWTDDALVYRTEPGENSTLYLPLSTDLGELSKFKRECRDKILNSSSRYSNIRVSMGSNETEKTEGKFSTLLCFYERVFSTIRSRNGVHGSWAILEIPFGSVKNVKLRTIDVPNKILKLLENITVHIYKEFIKEVFFFKDNPKGSSVDWDLTKNVREGLARAIMKNDFRSFTNNLLPRKGGHVGLKREARENLEELIYAWRLKDMGIPTEKLNTIKSVGNIVAKASKNNPGLLYKLDKIRTIDEFWSVLREISKKMLGFEDTEMRLVKPTSLDGMILLMKGNEKDWRVIRDLLVVYSSMYYSIRGKKEGDKNE